MLDGLRRDVAGLVGTDAGGVAFVEGGAAALEALLRAWPLPASARVGVAAAEWGPNLEVLRHHGHAPVALPVDARGVLDLEALERSLVTDPPDLVLVDLVAAHRGLVQPAAAVAALARGYGVPVWVDAAQALGHVDSVVAADAVVATSRKWLGGPRGVGVVAVAEPRRADLRVLRPAKLPDAPAVRLLESEEAHVAGRVGLAVAVQELLALGTAAVFDRLAEVGRQVREAVDALPGWSVLGADAPAGSTTALVPADGRDVERLRERLLVEDRILTSVCLPWRAPGELTGHPPALRVSAHVDLTDADLERLCEALART